MSTSENALLISLSVLSITAKLHICTDLVHCVKNAGCFSFYFLESGFYLTLVCDSYDCMNSKNTAPFEAYISFSGNRKVLVFVCYSQIQVFVPDKTRNQW